MKIIAFDPGLGIGYAVFENDKYITSGSVKNNTSISITDRMEHLKKTINSLLTLQPDLIAVEAIHRMQGQVNRKEINESTWALYWVFGEIISRAQLKNIPVMYIAPLTMKACLVPNEQRTEGQKKASKMASKQEVSQAVQNIIGERKMRNDESDAAGLAITAWRIHTGQYVVNSKKPKSKKK